MNIIFYKGEVVKEMGLAAGRITVAQFLWE